MSLIASNPNHSREPLLRTHNLYAENIFVETIKKTNLKHVRTVDKYFLHLSPFFFYRIVMYIHVDVYVFAYVIHIDFLSYTICLNQNTCPFIHR